jgi:hypothetical protein
LRERVDRNLGDEVICPSGNQRLRFFVFSARRLAFFGARDDFLELPFRVLGFFGPTGAFLVVVRFCLLVLYFDGLSFAPRLDCTPMLSIGDGDIDDDRA